MHKIILAACFALPAGAAVAQDLPPDFTQLFTASQEALQNMSSGETAETVLQGGSVQPASVSTEEPLTLAQTGMNAVNIIFSNQDLGSIYQRFDGIQSINNSIETERAPGLAPISINQTGANYANMVQGNTISLADQAMLSGSRQFISNAVNIGGPVGDIHQKGTNVANVALAEVAIGTAIQEIQDDVEQRVDNYIEINADTVVSGAITQRGFNYGNVLVADRVDEITRTFYGDQVVRNEIVLNASTVPMITQSGSNIANLVVANHIGSVQQISNGSQLVENIVTDGDGNPIYSANISQSDYNYQGPTNVINMMVLRGQHGHDDSEQPVAIDQQANFPQTGHGVSGSQTGNVTVIVR